MTSVRTIHLKINAEVPEGADPIYTAYQALRQAMLKAASCVEPDTLASWQELHAPISSRRIGELHYELVEEEEKTDV